MVSLDTSIRCTGYCVWNDGIYKRSGIISPPPKTIGDDALKTEASLILELLDKEKPDIIVVENTYQSGNLQVYRKLSMLVGVVLGWAVSHDCFFEALEAKRWRSAINTEFAKMKRTDAKAYSIQQANDKYKITVSTDDEADAILIGQAQIELFS